METWHYLVAGACALVLLILVLVLLNRKTKLRSYEGKTVWVTGASSGIGEGLAQVLGDLQVSKLILSARRAAVLEEVGKSIKTKNQNCEILICPLDIGDTNTMESKVKHFLAESKVQKIDMLVHNAGIVNRGLWKDSLDQVIVEQKIMQTNYLGAVKLTKVLWNTLVQSKSTLCIISSLSATVPNPCKAPYCSSKRALTGYFESLIPEAAEQGVTINIICPGYVHTNLSGAGLNPDGKVNGTNLDEVYAVGYTPYEAGQEILRCVQNDLKLAIITKQFKHKIAKYIKIMLPKVYNRLVFKHYLSIKNLV